MSKKKKPLNYQTAIQELEDIVERLKKDEISVDDLVQEVKAAKEIIEYCKKILRTTENDLDELIK